MQEAKTVLSEKPMARLCSQILLMSKRIFAPLALFFIGYIVWVSRFEITHLWATSNVSLLSLACLFLCFAHLFSPLASRQILQTLGVKVEYRMLLRTHMCRLPARYLPGGVWHTVGRAADLHEHGVLGATIAWLVALENMLAISIALLLGVIFLFVSNTQVAYSGWLFPVAATSSFVVLSALPILIGRFRRDEAPDMNFGAWIACCTWFVIIWAFHAAAFVTYSIALVGGSGESQSLHTAGVYLFSWAIGLLTFFAPQGVGIFEVTTVALSGQPMLAANIAMVAGFRLCMLVVDLFLGLTARLQK